MDAKLKAVVDLDVQQIYIAHSMKFWGSKTLANSCLFAFFIYVMRHCLNLDGKIWQTTGDLPNSQRFSSTKNFSMGFKSFSDTSNLFLLSSEF